MRFSVFCVKPTMMKQSQRLLPRVLSNPLTYSCLMLTGLTGVAEAADYYVLPSAAGAGDGSSWENAAQGTPESLADAITKLNAGDSLILGSGDYGALSFSIDQSGSEGSPITIRGEDTGSGFPLVKGNWDKSDPDSGPTFIKLKEGASHWIFDGFHVQNYKGVVYSRGENVGLVFSRFAVEDTRIGIFLNGGGITDNPERNSHDIEITDCRFVGFTKSAVRLQDGNYDVTVKNVYADAGGEPYGHDPFHMAFFIPGHKKGPAYSPADDHDITFINCEARNSFFDRGKKYWNGDGYATERGTRNITFINCRAFNATDGGWDVKSDNTLLKDCVAIGNKRNIRVWGTAKLENCLIAYSEKPGGSGGPSGLYLTSTAEVVAENCTIVNNDGPQVSIEDAKKGSKLELINCLVGRTDKPGATLKRIDDISVFEESGTVYFDDVATSPQFVELTENWDGHGPAFNNKQFGRTKGFYQN